MPERDQGMWLKLASQVFKQMGNAKIKAHKKTRESTLEWGVPLEGKRSGGSKMRFLPSVFL